jgi:hypothetical protein
MSCKVSNLSVESLVSLVMCVILSVSLIMEDWEIAPWQ